MRKSIATIVIAASLVTGAAVLPGCSSWLQNFKNNPVEQVQMFETAIQTAVTAAEVAWPAIEALLPANVRVQAQTQYTNALAAVTHTEQLLNDAVNVAVDAQQSSPNFTALMQAVSDAVAQVVAIVDQYTTSSTDAGTVGVATNKVPAPASVADLHASYVSLRHWGVTVRTVP